MNCAQLIFSFCAVLCLLDLCAATFTVSPTNVENVVNLIVDPNYLWIRMENLDKMGEDPAMTSDDFDEMLSIIRIVIRSHRVSKILNKCDGTIRPELREKLIHAEPNNSEVFTENITIHNCHLLDFLAEVISDEGYMFLTSTKGAVLFVELIEHGMRPPIIPDKYSAVVNAITDYVISVPEKTPNSRLAAYAIVYKGLLVERNGERHEVARKLVNRIVYKLIVDGAVGVIKGAVVVIARIARIINQSRDALIIETFVCQLLNAAIEHNLMWYVMDSYINVIHGLNGKLIANAMAMLRFPNLQLDPAQEGSNRLKINTGRTQRQGNTGKSTTDGDDESQRESDLLLIRQLAIIVMGAKKVNFNLKVASTLHAMFGNALKVSPNYFFPLLWTVGIGPESGSFLERIADYVRITTFLFPMDFLKETRVPISALASDDARERAKQCIQLLLEGLLHLGSHYDFAYKFAFGIWSKLVKHGRDLLYMFLLMHFITELTMKMCVELRTKPNTPDGIHLALFETGKIHQLGMEAVFPGEPFASQTDIIYEARREFGPVLFAQLDEMYPNVNYTLTLRKMLANPKPNDETLYGYFEEAEIYDSNTSKPRLLFCESFIGWYILQTKHDPRLHQAAIYMAKAVCHKISGVADIRIIANKFANEDDSIMAAEKIQDAVCMNTIIVKTEANHEAQLPLFEFLVKWAKSAIADCRNLVDYLIQSGRDVMSNTDLEDLFRYYLACRNSSFDSSVNLIPSFLTRIAKGHQDSRMNAAALAVIFGAADLSKISPGTFLSSVQKILYSNLEGIKFKDLKQSYMEKARNTFNFGNDYTMG